VHKILINSFRHFLISIFLVLRYFEWVPFDPRGIRGDVNNLELRKSGREKMENSRNAEEIGAEESWARSGRICNAIP
jgi:hypothetical protein